MSRMLKSSGAMALATLFSRILGMCRVMVYARFMGDSMVASAFVFAFQVPNLFRRLLGEGALSAALVPILKEKEVKEGDKGMWDTANAALSLLVCVCAVAVVLLIAGCSFLLWYGGWTLQTQLFLELLQIMSPYVLMVCAAAVLMGMCNARGIFFIPALGATMLNVVMIITVLFVAPHMGADRDEQVYALAYGILVAGLFQMLFQLPVLAKQGFRLRFVLPWKHPSVQEIIHRMIPGIIGVAAFQINVLLTNWIAYSQASHVVASFDYAVRLMELPQGVIGVSLATILLPTLSGLAAKKKFPEFRSTLKEGMGYVVYANLPASVLMFVLAEPIVRLLFEGSAFDAPATFRCQYALKCLLPGLVAFSLVNVCSRAFFALGDVKTPMRISVFCLGTNLVLAFQLIPLFEQGGMGMANTASSFLNLSLLIYALRKKFSQLTFTDMYRSLNSMVAACVLAGLVTWGCNALLDGWLGHNGVINRLLVVFVPLTLGGGVYAVTTYWLKVKAA
ncbi:MAG: murein biosynthesis integral membrane protein MurJ, partial [Verrucomicrobia bacterium]|nr:murein biosynthesis integral membrane protein MurJ [Verrucomicrobiota bacterium]